MLANQCDPPSEIRGPEQCFEGVPELTTGTAPSLVEYNIPKKAPPQAPTRQRGKARKKGGWPSSTCLKWTRDCKRIFDCFHVLRRAQRQPTLFITIMPPERLSAAQAKRWVSRALARLGEILKRVGCPHIGLTIYEVSVQGHVHAHHAAFVPPRFKCRVVRWVDKGMPGERDVRPFIPERHVGYMTKQREPLPPDFNRPVYGRPHERQRGGLIPGRRWSLTTAAKEIVGGYNAP